MNAMNDHPGQPWGMCAAFGCPLLGTVGSEGQWYCCCHVHRPTALNSAITARLRGYLAPVVETTLDIRRCGASLHESAELYRVIQRRLIAAGRRDLLLGFNGADCSPHRPGKPIVKQWLARLEGVLIAACAATGSSGRVSATVPTEPLDGPAHAAEFVAAAMQAIGRNPGVRGREVREPGSDDE
jgi:hypothetical protein